MKICRLAVSIVSYSVHSKATGACTMRGGLTWWLGAASRPAWASSLTSAGRRSPQRCIFSAIASSVRCTTNSLSRAMLRAVSFKPPSSKRLMLTMTMGGSSPSMLHMLKGAALTTPVSDRVVISAIGRGTIRLAISL
ncbi:hypothetical protein G6F40_013529 [Rhizopus arrhizus]|nr:hypothetical protein G6F40_013529 [Rhizopus arrhizus]